MWLLDTTTLKLKNFIEYKIPPYAILSHTWGTEEVSFQDISLPVSDLEGRAGYQKIKSCCHEALNDGFQYVWIDTCNIDKTNSVELSESINSMFRWYANADECYAYLDDVPDEKTDIAKSRWFTRGWTLQELLAPRSILFLDQKWRALGTRTELASTIATITGIPIKLLKSQSSVSQLENYSIAQRMQWAANRRTKRVEDKAYCLLGIFNVSMA
jgi:hypothetical protein